MTGATKQIPHERWAAFATAARASRSDKVIVAVRDATVRRQYERAVPRLGGNLENVIFHILGEVPHGHA